MSLGLMRRCATLLVVLIGSSLVIAQPTKLRVISPDSMVSRLGRQSLIRGTAMIEGSLSTLPGVLVNVQRWNDDSASFSSSAQSVRTTDTAGAFSFDAMSAGKVLLSASLRGYFPYTEEFDLVEGKQLTVNIGLVPDYSGPKLHTTGGISTEVSDASTGEPVGQARIHVLETNRQYQSDEAGLFQLYGLQSGEYHIRASSEGYQYETALSVKVKSGILTFLPLPLTDSLLTLDDLACLEKHRKDYPLTPIAPQNFGTITGEVYVRFVREPLADIYVYLAPYGHQTLTDSTGTFTFRGLRPGTYCLTVRVADIVRETKHGIRLEPGKTVTIVIPFSRPPWKSLEE